MSEKGRPSVMTAETISKLEEAFLNGATDAEAAMVAGIGARTLYDYCEANPDFSQRKEALKEMVKYRARQNIVDAINSGDKILSQWYLERKAKNEFSTRTENTGRDGGDLIPKKLSPEHEKALNDIIEGWKVD